MRWRGRRDVVSMLVATVLCTMAAAWSPRQGADPQSPSVPTEATAPPPSEAPSTPVPPRRFDAALEARLAALDPARPIEYLRLAEEIEARARTPQERQLARELYGLAGALDPVQLGASAALAQAALAEKVADRARLVRLGAALRPVPRASPSEPALTSGAARFAQLLGAYRRGQGPRARELLADPEVSAFVETFAAHFEGGAEGFRNAIAGLRDRPVETPSRMLELMFLEEALLSGDDGFVADLLRTNGEPLAAADPLRPGPEFGVDPELPRWRDGRWSR